MANQNWVDLLEAKLLGVRQLQDGGTTILDANGNPAGYAILNAVAPLRAAGNPSEARFDLSIDPLALIPEILDSKTAHVDPTGDDLTGQVGSRTLKFATHGAALAAILLLGPSPATPFLIKTHPGTYSEPPLTLYSGVTLSSTDGPGTVSLVASTPGSPLITAQTGSFLSGVTLAGAAAPGGIGVLVPGGRVVVTGCVVASCEKLVKATGGAQLFLYSCTGQGGTSTIAGFESTASAVMVVLGGSVLTGIQGDPVELMGGPGLLANGGLLQPITTGVQFCAEGMRAENGGEIVGSASAAQSCTIGLRIAPTGGTIRLAGTSVSSSISEDGSIESTSAEFVASGLLHEKPFSVVAGAKVFGAFLDNTSKVTTQEGATCVGTKDRPGQFTAGEGCPYTDGLQAWHYDGATHTDVTAELISTAGSSIDVVPGTGVGNYLLIGADQPFTGFLFDVALAQVGGAMGMWVWTGSWTAIDWMTHLYNPPYTPSGNSLFAAGGMYDELFGSTAGWISSSEGGVTKYYARIGPTSLLTTIPKLESVKLHGNYSRKGPDGTDLFYGNSRPPLQMDLDMSTWRLGTGTSPGTTSIPYSAGISVGSAASFTSGPTTRELGRRLQLPERLDTSLGVTIKKEWRASNVDTGAINANLRGVPVPPGATLIGALPGEQTVNHTPSAPGILGATTVLSSPLAIPTAVAGTYGLALQFERVGGDAHTGNLDITAAWMDAYRWRS